MCQTRNPILCIVPPHMLKHMAQSPALVGKQLAEWAWRTMVLSGLLLGSRLAIGAFAPMLAIPTGGKRRTIYDAGHSETLPGKLVRGEDDPSAADPAVNEAYDGAGATYDLYYEEYNRNSIDDRGMRLDSTVHYGQKYDNAFWEGRQMVYGDGDGQIFQRFTKSIDVIGHELTHGVTQYEAGLNYQGQPGALNESFSDVFGSLVKQRTLGQTAAQADWLIGEGLFTSNVQGVALRSMKDPGTAYNDPRIGKDPQPAHMRDYVNTYDDNGGVHINSGIPNHAFYLTAFAIGGNAWKKAGKIWYVTLRDRLLPNAQFQDAATATCQVASELYGPTSSELQAVADAWKAVGISVPGRQPKPKPPGTTRRRKPKSKR